MLKKVFIFLVLIFLLASCKQNYLEQSHFQGVNNNSIYIGEQFDPYHYVMAYNGNNKDISDKILIEGDVNTNYPGIYHLTYKIVEKDKVYLTKERTITVISKKPIISDPKRVIEIEFGDDIDLLICLSAYDDVDKDITDKIIIKDLGRFDKHRPGSYIITYQVTDSQKQITTHKRKIIVREPQGS